MPLHVLCIDGGCNLLLLLGCACCWEEEGAAVGGRVYAAGSVLLRLLFLPLPLRSAVLSGVLSLGVVVIVIWLGVYMHCAG